MTSHVGHEDREAVKRSGVSGQRDGGGGGTGATVTAKSKFPVRCETEKGERRSCPRELPTLCHVNSFRSRKTQKFYEKGPLMSRALRRDICPSSARFSSLLCFLSSSSSSSRPQLWSHICQTISVGLQGCLFMLLPPLTTPTRHLEVKS